MSKNLTIIFGAGASYSQNLEKKESDNQGYRPPLTKDLFSPIGTFAPILNKYPAAETLASDINSLIRQNKQGLGLEQILKQYQDRLENNEESFITRNFLHIPLYLNDLFGEVSQHFTHQPDEYNTVVKRAIDKADKVLFLTLNYDTILEIPLRNLFYVDFSSLNHYLSDPRWSLVKLHGSTNWYKTFSSYQKVVNYGEYIEHLRRQSIRFKLADDYVMFPVPGHQKIDDGGVPLYPSITVPIDGKYDLNCPSEMLEHTKEFLKISQNVLIVGTSGRDEDLKDLLKENLRGGNTMIVGRDKESIERTQLNLLENIPQLGIGYRKYYNGRGFSGFVDDGMLDEYLDNLLDS